MGTGPAKVREMGESFYRAVGLFPLEIPDPDETAWEGRFPTDVSLNYCPSPRAETILTQNREDSLEEVKVRRA